VGFEPINSAFERAKIVHALDRAATVIGTEKHIGKVNDLAAKNAFKEGQKA
jgi:hypothetical protein